MEKDFQIGPHSVKSVHPLQFHHTVQHTEHPRRDAADVSDVHVHRCTGNLVALLLEIAQKGYLLLGNAYDFGSRRDVLYQDGTQIAHKTIGCVEVGGMAATKNEAFARE